MVTTVSDTYAEEIKTQQYGEGLDGLLRCKSDFLKGIVNGIDYEEFDPEKDNLIFKNFTWDSISDKVENKLSLQKRTRITTKGRDSYDWFNI